ncbi:hypothetical protein CHELA1G11_11807 [Hyphomicrobiales bacterium]|nr:hypothetical protein CHELA1G11_11807 [Hyphomicrobiales bacterium]CAH1665296.1 hypothetical protein CHELA1G2_12501 [Hyphomicrobiales bacterium]
MPAKRAGASPTPLFPAFPAEAPLLTAAAKRPGRSGTRLSKPEAIKSTAKPIARLIPPV